jgi:hypothetical protein
MGEKTVRNYSGWKEIGTLIKDLQEADGCLVCVTRKNGDNLAHNMVRVNLSNDDIVDGIDHYEKMFFESLSPRKKRMLQIVKDQAKEGTDKDPNQRSFS